MKPSQKKQNISHESKKRLEKAKFSWVNNLLFFDDVERDKEGLFF
jgi:hypothetical protein